MTSQRADFNTVFWGTFSEKTNKQVKQVKVIIAGLKTHYLSNAWEL